MDHPDFIALRAPRPSIIVAAEQDYKDIRFTRKTFAEARRVYALLGHPDRMDMFAFDDQHAFSRPRREAAVRWMRRWLLDDATVVSEPELKIQSPKAVQVTQSGQVLREFPDAVSVVRSESQAGQATRIRPGDFLEIPGPLQGAGRDSRPRRCLRDLAKLHRQQLGGRCRRQAKRYQRDQPRNTVGPGKI